MGRYTKRAYRPRNNLERMDYREHLLLPLRHHTPLWGDMAHYNTRMLNSFFTFLIPYAFAQSRANFLTNQPSITNTDIANPFPSAPKPPLIQLFGEQRPYEDVNPNTIPNPLGITDLNGLVNTIIDALTVIAVPVVLAMVLFGAFKIITSAGDPKKAKDGGMIIFYAAVGFGLLLISNGIVSIVQSLLS